MLARKKPVFFILVCIFMSLSFSLSAMEFEKYSERYQVGKKNFVKHEGTWRTHFKNRLGDQIITDRLIVRLKSKAVLKKSDLKGLKLRGLEIVKQYPTGHVVLRAGNTNSKQFIFRAAKTLFESGKFEQPEFDSYGTRAVSANDQGSQWPIPLLGVESAWNITKGSPNVIIAVIDSGADINHPDLIKNFWANPGESGGGKETNGVDDDGNGYIDDVRGWDFMSSNNDVGDSHGHGTTVSGVCSANTNNNVGVAGIAGGWGTAKGCSLMVLKDGNSSPSRTATINALLYAAKNGARIVNISTVFYDGSDPNVTPSTFLQSTVNYVVDNYGVIVVAAAGNNDDYPVGAPACYPNTICVGGSTTIDTADIAFTTGPELDVIAPSGLVYTTDIYSDYGSFSGTSMAAPFVSGTLGLMYSVRPSLSFDQARSIIRGTAVKVEEMDGENFTNIHGYGRLDVGSAVSQAQTAPTLTVIKPYAGSVFRQLESCQITWSRDNYSGAVRVKLYNSAGLVRTISSGTWSSQLTWTIPDTVAPGQYRIKVESYTDPTISDFSDKPFTIEEKIVIPPFELDTFRLSPSRFDKSISTSVFFTYSLYSSRSVDRFERVIRRADGAYIDPNSGAVVSYYSANWHDWGVLSTSNSSPTYYYSYNGVLNPYYSYSNWDAGNYVVSVRGYDQGGTISNTLQLTVTIEESQPAPEIYNFSLSPYSYSKSNNSNVYFTWSLTANQLISSFERRIVYHSPYGDRYIDPYTGAPTYTNSGWHAWGVLSTSGSSSPFNYSFSNSLNPSVSYSNWSTGSYTIQTRGYNSNGVQSNIANTSFRLTN